MTENLIIFNARVVTPLGSTALLLPGIGKFHHATGAGS